MYKKTALIFGITGQDGSHMAKFLVQKKYSVHGTCRGNNYKNLIKLNLLKKINLHIHKKFNDKKLLKLLKKNFDEIYFLGGQSSVSESFKKRAETYDSQIQPLKNILDFITFQKNKKSKFLYAGSSELFGNINKKKKIKVDSKKKPLSPYGMSKFISYEIIKSYRKMYKLPICTAILFNHESHLRAEQFIFKKIVNNIKKIKINEDNKLKVGNINIKRDWGWAPEYMRVCHKILNSKKIDDYIIATGKTVSLKKIIILFFKKFNLDWKKYTIIDKSNFRNFEIKENYADISNIKKNINWKPVNDYRNVIQKLINKDI